MAQMVATVHAFPLYTVLAKIHNTVEYKDGRVWNDPWAYKKEDFIKREHRQAPLPTTKIHTDKNKNQISVWDSDTAGSSTQIDSQNKKVVHPQRVVKWSQIPLKQIKPNLEHPVIVASR